MEHSSTKDACREKAALLLKGSAVNKSYDVLTEPTSGHCSYLDPLKTPENSGFLVFLGDINWEHWPELG